MSDYSMSDLFQSYFQAKIENTLRPLKPQRDSFIGMSVLLAVQFSPKYLSDVWLVVRIL
jgi:hypothetical protein